MGEQYTIAERMKQLRNITGFNRAEFARFENTDLTKCLKDITKYLKEAGI